MKRNIIQTNYNTFFNGRRDKENETFFRSYLKSLGFAYDKFVLDNASFEKVNKEGIVCVNKEILMENLKKELGDCKRCPLYKTRNNIVFGVGNPCSDIMFIGEAPGEEEDLKGEPFVGRAGRLLDNMLATIGLSRDKNIYIANVLKSRPPENKIANHLDSIPICLPFLMKQIEIVSPKIICCLGAIASQTILKTNLPISKIRGHFHEWNGIKVLTTYHPSFLLRNPISKKEVWEDLKKLKKMIDVLKEV